MNDCAKSVSCEAVFVVIFFKTMTNKTIIRFGFCDIRNNQGLGKCYQPRPSASADNTYLELIWLFRISQKPHPIIVHYLHVIHGYLLSVLYVKLTYTKVGLETSRL